MYKYYEIGEILTIIDKRFGYEFEGKDEDDHLIASETWNKYFREFFEAEEDRLYETLNHDEWDKIDSIIEDKRNRRTRNRNKYKKYREDLVEEIISFREENLVKQFNSNRKMTIDHHAIKIFENFAEILDLKVDPSIYEKKIPKTKYFKMKNERIPIPSKEEMREKKEELLQIIFEQLIDKEKFNDDIQEFFMNNSLIHGYTDPFVAIEINGELLGFKIDATNYLKDNIINEIIHKPKY